ncbi:hypothetical protein E4U14_003732, partial [Claviceps sp. LM454 group G7]
RSGRGCLKVERSEDGGRRLRQVKTFDPNADSVELAITASTSREVGYCGRTKSAKRHVHGWQKTA